MKELKPLKIQKEWGYITSLFLAGSIEQGKADHWQERIVKSLEDKNVLIFNPRRDAWNPNWKQSKDNLKFKNQVEWELEHLETAELACFYFDPNTKSPITLLELGLTLGKKGFNEIFVYCPEGYWRKGNVDITCKKFNVKVYESEDELIEAVRFEIDDIEKYLINGLDYRSDWRG